uniref:Large ribosomal subunit protein bL25 L25 domain-containing protein n=1 Tax=Rhodnius prolixus TaxID=13249 RepID=T1HWQ9_RHOPR
MPKQMLYGDVYGTRRKGRPRRRWLQDVEDDLKTLSVRRWKEKAMDRDVWKGIIKEAKAHPGLYTVTSQASLSGNCGLEKGERVSVYSTYTNTHKILSNRSSVQENPLRTNIPNELCPICGLRHRKGAIQTAPCRSSSSFGIIQGAYSVSSQCQHDNVNLTLSAKEFTKQYKSGALSAHLIELDISGKKEYALVRDIQWHVVKDTVAELMMNIVKILVFEENSPLYAENRDFNVVLMEPAGFASYYRSNVA